MHSITLTVTLTQQTPPGDFLSLLTSGRTNEESGKTSVLLTHVSVRHNEERANDSFSLKAFSLFHDAFYFSSDNAM